MIPVEGDGDVAADGGGFDLTGFLQMLMVRKRIIIGSVVAVVAMTAVIVFHMTPLYDADAVVMLDQRQNKIVDVDTEQTGLPEDDVAIENQLYILQSRALMSRVVEKLHLDRQEEKPSALGLLSTVAHFLNPLHWFDTKSAEKSKEDLAQKRRENAIDDLLGGETVVALGRSSAMKITYRSEDPNQASTLANAIADAYVDDQLNAKFEATQKTSQWLADRLQQLQTQMQGADAAVQQYKAENNITETQGGGSILDQQLAELNGQLVLAKSQLAEAQAKYARVKALAASGQAEDVAQVFQSGMIGTLRQEQADLLRQKAQLATTFGPRHPKMLDIESQLRNVDAKIKEEVNRVVETVANDVAVASAHVASLNSSLNELEAQSGVQNKAKIKLTELQARSASIHQLYDAFLSKFKETQGTEAIQTPDARVISRAVVPTSPAAPNKVRSIELAVVGGLLIGLVLAYLAERLDSGFRTVEQIEGLLGVPVLATLPELRGVEQTGGQAADRVVDKPISSFSEAVRGLYLGLTLTNVDVKPKVFIVTSSVPEEGKTTASLSLARIIAQSKKRVVLIDGDFRRPNLLKALGLPEAKAGMIELLSGGAVLQDCMVKDPKSEVLLLPSSRVSGNPPDLIGSTAMERLIAGLKSSFDAVVIDSAPLLPVNDTKILARLADAIVLAVRWERTPRTTVANAARALTDVKAKVAGVVLTRADTDRYHYYSYGYQSYQSYNKYYSD